MAWGKKAAAPARTTATGGGAAADKKGGTKFKVPGKKKKGVEQPPEAREDTSIADMQRELQLTGEKRHGYYINPDPTIPLSTPPPPPALTPEQRAARDAEDKAVTDEISHKLGKYMEIVKNVQLFAHMGVAEIESAARSLQLKHFAGGEMVYDEGVMGDDCWVVISGEVVSSALMPGVTIPGTWEFKETRPYEPGKCNCFFGERGLLRKEIRKLRMVCRTDALLGRITAPSYVECARISEHKENLLRSVDLFAQMTDAQIGQLAACIAKVAFKEGEVICKQDDPGVLFYLVEVGECSATRGASEVKRYTAGEMFGEKSLFGDCQTDATVTACEDTVVYTLSRTDFEARLGPLAALQRAQYLADPRKLISDFYMPGDQRGSAGTLLAKGLTPEAHGGTSWFAVYRPCSRDSIAKMLGRVGVGKGLNIKGKSAQKNRLSGFVPYLQINDNDHKTAICKPPKDARYKIYFKNVMARDMAVQTLTKVLRECAHLLEMAEPEIRFERDYEPKSFGLDVPEPLVKEAYIMRSDISPMIGWETGRGSVPQFMDMNMASVRGNSKPSVVLYQHDLSDPMNPLGLLIAYAEKDVKPVCSDFDTFVVGTRGMRYEPTPPDQVEVINWTLDRTSELLAAGNTKGWTGHWLEMMKRESENPDSFKFSYPEYGFGDPTSYKLVEDVIAATVSCGAVRHGAECFNFGFPQELDKEFLCVWDGINANPTSDNPAWKPVGADELRAWLMDRVREGYGFPMNPVWAVRDPGWNDVLQALKRNSESKANLDLWFPPESGVLQKIEALHAQYPEGFAMKG